MPISYIFQLRQHSARLSCALIIAVNILMRIVYRSLYCVLTLIPAEQFNTTNTNTNTNNYINVRSKADK